MGGGSGSGGGSLEDEVGHTVYVIIYYDSLINNFNLQLIGHHLISDWWPGPVILVPGPVEIQRPDRLFFSEDDSPGNKNVFIFTKVTTLWKLEIESTSLLS